MKQIILLLFITSLSFSQFKFSKALPDPYYKVVVLGTNNNITDIAPSGWGVVCHNLAVGEIAKFGHSSISLNIDHNQSVIFINYNSYYDPLSYGNDYTIELWFYDVGTATGGSWFLKSAMNTMYEAFGITTLPTEIIFSNSNTPNPSNQATPYRYTYNSFNKNTWFHVAQSRKGNSVYYFVNGNLVHTYNSNNGFGNTYRNSPASVGSVGRSTDTAVLPKVESNRFCGYVQAIKFSTIARYTSNFVPSKPY